MQLCKTVLKIPSAFRKFGFISRNPCSEHHAVSCVSCSLLPSVVKLVMVHDSLQMSEKLLARKLAEFCQFLCTQIVLALAAIAAAQSPTANPSGLTGLRGCTIPFRANVAPVAGQSGQFTVVFTPQVQMPDVDVNLLYSINKTREPRVAPLARQAELARSFTATAPGKIEFDVR